MNKSKIVLAATGGVIGAAVLAAAFLAWQSWSAVSEARDGGDSGEGLESVLSRASSLARKDVYPCAESIEAINANRERFEEWKAGAKRLVEAGDLPCETTTPAAFKEQLLLDARRLSALPGSADGAIVRQGFGFGPFREYILDGKLPPEAQLPKLQRQWEDIVSFVEILAKAGIGELTGIEVAAATPAPEQKDTARKGQKRQKRKGGDAKSQKDEPEKATVEKYTVMFSSSPDAFVRAVNVLSTTNRFITVEDFSIVRAKDDLKEAFEFQDGKKEASAASGRRSRRARRGEAEEEKKVESPREAALRQGVIADPQIDTPLSVELKLAVRDFGSQAADVKGEEEEK